jgi:hypothetical protein
MSKVVFVLGAGASADTGAPLMANFLDVARQSFANKPHDQYAPDLERVFSAISELQKVHSKSELNLVNLESVFSAFEMAELLDIAPGSPELTSSMRRLIEWTLNESIHFDSNQSGLLPHGTYKRLADLVKQMRDCCVITFNYDIALDFAMFASGLNPSYSLDNSVASVSLLKLHGSVNWSFCSDCQKIAVKDVSERVGGRIFSAAASRASKKWGMLGSNFKCGCGKVLTDALIVPPTWDKAVHRNAVASVWKQAARELAEATDIFVCGYSMPETDSFFRYLYALGTVSHVMLKRFWVFDPAEEVHQRFESLLGPGARVRFRAEPHYFHEALAHIEGALMADGALSR